MLNVLSRILTNMKWFIIIGGITKSNKVKIIYGYSCIALFR